MKTGTRLQQLPYTGNEKSKLTLHLFLQIIGKIRLSLSHRKNHWWYITEYVDTKGFTTGPIFYDSGESTFTITLNILSHKLEVDTSEGESAQFDLHEGLTVADFYKKLRGILSDFTISVNLLEKPYDLGIEESFSEITAYHHYNQDYITKLWKTFQWVDGVFKEFSGRFYGKTCPVHVYWHSMDIAVTRFSGKKAPPMLKEARISDKDAYTHDCISFGFWAGDDNMKEPAFYSYTYPAPEGIDKKPLQPDNAFWMDANGSPMAILKYNDLLTKENPRETLLAFMESAYRAGASLANWDIDELEVPSLRAL
ncbi:DUF5996 family protein [uncultured Marixanthomonas sp.]|uniref:DUF5996 family protein n=1 Tax=uncultured Marixanthomonas sp. TaxID=757245 RepID=UPI0030DBD952|tara:strand:+ start:13567 stop:14496 length:930 start_codon:yes stop_codon:yes gene_type:complete